MPPPPPARVQAALHAVGGGRFTLQFDRETPHHTISRGMIERLILPALC